jgi:hypothetical protein
MWIKGIDSEVVSRAKFDPGSGHDLHEPKGTARRYCAGVAVAFDSHHSANPMLGNLKSASRISDERSVCGCLLRARCRAIDSRD